MLTSHPCHAGKASSWGLDTITIASETHEGEALDILDAIATAVCQFASQSESKVTALTEVSEHEHSSTCIRPEEWYRMKLPGSDRPQLVLLQRMFLIQAEGSHIFARGLLWDVPVTEGAGGVLRIPVAQYSPACFKPQIINLSAVPYCMHHDMARVGEECLMQPTFS